jgi:hypothetical protein
MFKKRGQGQSWSMDIILAFVVFVLVIGIFYALLTNNNKDKTADLTLESRTLVSSLDMANGQVNQLTIIEKGNIETVKLETLYQSQDDYMKIKRQLGIRGDFCIYVVDQYGKIIVVKDTDGNYTLASFGNDTCTVSSNPCGRPINP